jgi:hypothetical protein
MGQQGPENIMFPPDRLCSRPRRQFPNPDRLILSTAYNQLVLYMENSGGDVIESPPARIHLRSLHPDRPRNDCGCRVGHAGAIVTVVDAVPHAQRQTRLALKEDAGGDLVAEDGIILIAHNVDS